MIKRCGQPKLERREENIVDVNDLMLNQKHELDFQSTSPNRRLVSNTLLRMI